MMSIAASAWGQDLPPAFTLPWADVSPALSPQRNVLRAVAIGAPDPRIARFSARRDSARSRARQRALTMMHGWVDAQLARVNASPSQADAAHRAVERSTTVSGVRPLADGGAVVMVELPMSALREACPRPGVPW